VTVKLSDADFSFQYIRSRGPGGQHVNKTETAIVLRFNVLNACLPEDVRTRLILLLGRKMTQAGDFIIKADRFRNRERNKQDAIQRLMKWLEHASMPPKRRKKTRPTLSSKKQRLQSKKIRGKIKLLRSRKPLSHE